MAAESIRIRDDHSLAERPLGRAHLTGVAPRAGRAVKEGPGVILHLEGLDLDLLGGVARRLESWAGLRGWRVTRSSMTLHPDNSAPSSTRFPFHDPLAWPVVGREREWIEAHRRDLELFTEPAPGTLHLQCSGWLRTLACLRARGQGRLAEMLEAVGAEMPTPDHAFVLEGAPGPPRLVLLDPDEGPDWPHLGRAFEARVAQELRAAAVEWNGARVLEANPGWGAAHYGLQIESVLAREGKLDS